MILFLPAATPSAARVGVIPCGISVCRVRIVSWVIMMVVVPRSIPPHCKMRPVVGRHWLVVTPIIVIIVVIVVIIVIPIGA